MVEAVVVKQKRSLGRHANFVSRVENSYLIRTTIEHRLRLAISNYVGFAMEMTMSPVSACCVIYLFFIARKRR